MCSIFKEMSNYEKTSVQLTLFKSINISKLIRLVLKTAAYWAATFFGIPASIKKLFHSRVDMISKFEPFQKWNNFDLIIKKTFGFVLFVDFEIIRYSLLTTLTSYDFGTFEQILTFFTQMAEKSGKIQIFLLELIIDWWFFSDLFYRKSLFRAM